MLEHGQDVVSGIFEPGDQRPSAPEDALLVLVEAVKALEAHAALDQLVNGPVDVVHREVEDRE